MLCVTRAVHGASLYVHVPVHQPIHNCLNATLKIFKVLSIFIYHKSLKLKIIRKREKRIKLFSKHYFVFIFRLFFCVLYRYIIPIPRYYIFVNKWVYIKYCILWTCFPPQQGTCFPVPQFFLFKNNLFIYLFLAMLGLLCCAGFSLAVANRGCSLAVVCRLLTAVASLAVEYGI